MSFVAAILHGITGAEDVILEEGVVWVFGSSYFDMPGNVNWHSMRITGADGRFAVHDELDTTGYCCNHCSGDIDPTAQVQVNGVETTRGWLHGGDVLGFGDRRWRVELRRGPASPLGDLFRVAPPPVAMQFRALLHRFEEALDAESMGGLIRFAHIPGCRRDITTSFLRAQPRLADADPTARTASAALALALVRMDALPRTAAEKALSHIASDSSYDRWIQISALGVLALDESTRRWSQALRAAVLAALEDGDSAAAVLQACESLALVLEDEPLRSLGEAARAVVSDASARKRRTIAVSVLAALSQRDPECARAVLRAASDPHAQVRLAAARALVRLPSLHAGSADAALLALLGDADDDVFEEAFAALFGSEPHRVTAEALLAEVDRAAGDPMRLARLTQALDRLV